ncbi:WAS/WASL-interacting protein family member 1-like [Amblyraja radiata]|uniref:WAS/WASL-interacting protein family member 1-like n=1 Tax=Amblyraja radiata TaxID=386614 RepID=UPI0014030DB6|nr:WAS/WASL-interacting protein family member 1-like [Amblyraja radiata]
MSKVQMEIYNVIEWCQNHNLATNVSKTKESPQTTEEVEALFLSKSSTDIFKTRELAGMHIHCPPPPRSRPSPRPGRNAPPEAAGGDGGESHGWGGCGRGAGLGKRGAGWVGDGGRGCRSAGGGPGAGKGGVLEAAPPAVTPRCSVPAGPDRTTGAGGRAPTPDTDLKQLLPLSSGPRSRPRRLPGARRAQPSQHRHPGPPAGGWTKWGRAGAAAAILGATKTTRVREAASKERRGPTAARTPRPYLPPHTHGRSSPARPLARPACPLGRPSTLMQSKRQALLSQMFEKIQHLTEYFYRRTA